MEPYIRGSETRFLDEYVDVANIIDVFEKLSEYGCDDEKTLDDALAALEELDKGMQEAYILCNGRTVVIRRKKDGGIEIFLS